MLEKIQIKELGTVPRKFIPAHIEAKRKSYRKIGEEFHTRMALRRFTYAHGVEAGYRPRSGDTLAYGSKAYYSSYVGRKKRLKGHRDPMVWSGTTRERARIATIKEKSNAATVQYRLNVFNFHPWMHDEFKRVLPSEAAKLGRVFDKEYKLRFNDAKNS